MLQLKYRRVNAGWVPGQLAETGDDNGGEDEDADANANEDEDEDEDDKDGTSSGS